MLIELADVRRLLASVGLSTAEPRQIELYRSAFQHASGNKKDNYERLEFLGDAVLGLAVTSYLFARYPRENEGFMTRMRTKLVNGPMLADLCERCVPPLTRFIQSASGETAARASVREDVFEAFLAAVYLDIGFEVAKEWLIGVLEANVDFAQLVAHQNSPKDLLNKYFLANFGDLPTFEHFNNEGGEGLISDGVGRGGGEIGGHGGQQGSCCGGERRFRGPGPVHVRVRDCRGMIIASHDGPNRKDAENAAARKALSFYHVRKSKTT